LQVTLVKWATFVRSTVVGVALLLVAAGDVVAPVAGVLCGAALVAHALFVRSRTGVAGDVIVGITVAVILGTSAASNSAASVVFGLVVFAEGLRLNRQGRSAAVTAS
jgi:hypothetical protein